MALKLVKPGPVLRPYDKGVGGVTSTGWQTVTFDGNVYQSVEPGLYQFIMSGTKCSGLRLYLRSAAEPRVNQYMLDTGVLSSIAAPTLNAVIEMREGDTFFGQVNGETPDTQVWLMTQKLSSLSLIEITRLEAVEQPSGWSKWSGEAPPWATVGESSLSLQPGTYRVFSPNGARLYYSPPWEFVREIGENEIISHDTKTLMLYAGKSSAGLFIISKLA